MPWNSSPYFTPESLTNMGAFGGLKIATETPLVTLQFQYNLNTEKVSTTTANGGTATQANSEAVLQTSTANNGSALLQSKRDIRYTPGQGTLLRFTARFTTGVANSQQEAGIGGAADGFYFGYVGTAFGIIHRKNSVDTFVAQSAWNENTLSDLNPTKGNVYSINYQWLGYGVIKFFIEKNDGSIVLVHKIQYSNANTSPSLTNPMMGFRARVVNSGNTTNLTLSIPSVGIFAEGPITNRNIYGAATNRKTGIGGTATNILTIRNNTTFAGVTNTTNVRLSMCTMAASSDCVLRVIRNTTLGGVPSFADFDTNTSIVAVDTAGTTITGGRFLTGLVSESSGGSPILNFTAQDYRIAPGETLTFAATSVGGTAAVNVLVAWEEEF